MNNCSDIIATCTIAASSNAGDPYTAMKSAILDYTQKPKWSCYMDLHSLPPQGDIRPSQLMAKLTNTLPHGTATNTDLFYSFFMFRMPQYLREVLAANEYTPPPPQPTDPASGPRHRTSTAATPTAAATPAAPQTAAAQRATAAVEPRPQIRNFQMMVPVGTTGNIRNAQRVAEPLAIGPDLMPGRETARPPARAHGPSGRRPPRPLPNSHSNGDVFFARLRFNVFERFTQPVKFPSRPPPRPTNLHSRR